MRSVLLIAAMLFAHGALAQSPYGEIRFGPRVGHGNLDLDAGRSINGGLLRDNDHAGVLGVGGTVEYHAPFGLVLEAGRFVTEEVTLFDSDPFRYREIFASIGWRIDLGKGFSLVPRAGRSHWKLRGDDEAFRDREPNLDVDGYQNYWEIGGFKTIKEALALGLSYKQNNYAFGEARLTSFTVLFRFGNGSSG